jgi:hypothetical protein
MTGSPYPTTWTFDLDERTTRMSLLSTSPSEAPIYATPVSIRQVLATFKQSATTPSDVVDILIVSADLLETSVIHYEFAALAVEKALQALELLIRLRVDQTPTAGMSRLIESLRKRYALRSELDEFLRDMLYLRNSWVGHPRGAVAYPMVIAVGFLRHIYAAIAEIADLDN